MAQRIRQSEVAVITLGVIMLGLQTTGWAQPQRPRINRPDQPARPQRQRPDTGSVRRAGLGRAPMVGQIHHGGRSSDRPTVSVEKIKPHRGGSGPTHYKPSAGGTVGAHPNFGNSHHRPAMTPAQVRGVIAGIGGRGTGPRAPQVARPNARGLSAGSAFRGAGLSQGPRPQRP